MGDVVIVLPRSASIAVIAATKRVERARQELHELMQALKEEHEVPEGAVMQSDGENVFFGPQPKGGATDDDSGAD